MSIHDAANSGDIEAVKNFLAAGTDVNAIDDDWTPLVFAVDKGHKEIVEILIAKGADVDAKGQYDWNAFHGAALHGRTEIAGLLIAKGVDVNAKNEEGYTPLFYAAYKGHKEVAELLISKGADVNAQMDDGRTSLDWATDGKYPWAVRRKHTETADLLRKHGGKTGEELEAEGK